VAAVCRVSGVNRINSERWGRFLGFGLGSPDVSFLLYIWAGRAGAMAILDGLLGCSCVSGLAGLVALRLAAPQPFPLPVETSAIGNPLAAVSNGHDGRGRLRPSWLAMNYQPLSRACQESARFDLTRGGCGKCGSGTGSCGAPQTIRCG